MSSLTVDRPRLSAVRAFLAGAAILAGATVTSAGAQEPSDDTAMAIPRLSAPNGDGVALPRPLSSADARLIRTVFANPAASLADIAASPLLGHVLADRYLAPASRPTADDLRSWLSRFPALPDAPAIHALLLTKLPRGATPPPAPNLAATALPLGDEIEAPLRLIPRTAAIDRAIREADRTGQFDHAVGLIRRTPGVSPVYAALLKAEVAQAMFSEGHDLQALALASAANEQAHGQVGQAAWIAGLAAWRLGRPELARAWFETAYRAPLTAPGQRAGAAFWAARASLVIRGDHGPWMQRAARDPRTFYGLLARRVLGQPIHAPPAPQETLGEADVDAVAATFRGQRAFALLQVGQPYRAAAELRLLWAETREQPGFGRSILVVARAAGLNDLVDQLQTSVQPATVRLPASQLRPNGGFRLDPALIYALTRLESNFDPTVVSRAGARGLMQLMPSTAQVVSDRAPGRPILLHDPATNLDLGQRLLLKLGTLDLVGSDLIRMLVTYNAGNGTLARWLEAMPQTDDPLIFLASLPGDETRAYVSRALAYTWLYAAQLGVPSPSLDELAAGLWPRLQVRRARRDPVVRLH